MSRSRISAKGVSASPTPGNGRFAARPSLVPHVPAIASATVSPTNNKKRNRDGADGAAATKKARTSTSTRVARPYVPALFSGSWSLLIALLHFEATAPGGGGLFSALTTWKPESSATPSKTELERLASMLCRSSFKRSHAADSPYTAWNSMTDLRKKGLTRAFNAAGRGRVFTLTGPGRVLAVELIEEYAENRAVHEEKLLSSDKYQIDLTQVWNLVREILVIKDPTSFTEIATYQSHTIPALSFDDVTASPRKSIIPATTSKALIEIDDSDDDTAYQSLDHQPVPTHVGSAVSNGRSLPPVVRSSRSSDTMMSSSIPNRTWTADSLHRQKRWGDIAPGSTMPKAIDSLEVVLLMDCREVTGQGPEHMQRLLRTVGVKYEMRALHLGDMMWIVRRPGVPGEANELVLDFIVERKTVPDLISSVKDGRYEEQKYRLAKQTVVRQVIYLLEGNISEAHLKRSNSTMGTLTLRKLLHLSQVEVGFSVKHTLTTRATAEYLLSLTDYLRSRCERFNWEELLTAHSPFPVVQELTRKSTQLRYRDIFAMMLLKAKRCSPVATKALVTKYGCPRQLYDLFESSDLSEDRRAMLLANFRLGVNNRTVGAVLSRRLYGMFSDYTPGEFENLSQAME